MAKVMSLERLGYNNGFSLSHPRREACCHFMSWLMERPTPERTERGLWPICQQGTMVLSPTAHKELNPVNNHTTMQASLEQNTLSVHASDETPPLAKNWIIPL